jgi:hypothetical protein
MYVPYWSFDAKVRAEATFRAEEEEEYNDDDEVVTRTKIYECYRAGKMAFERIPVDGSVKMDDTFMESIEPFDYKQLEPFTPAYLTGALADRYDVDAEAAVSRADERIADSAVELLQDTVEGYDSVTIQGEPTVHKKKGAVTYAMAPVWILTTRYENTPYMFLMNGQTGKIAGSLPYDNVKSYIYMGVSSLIALPICYFLIDFVSEEEELLSTDGVSMTIVFIGALICAVLCGYGVRKYLIDQMSNVHPAADATAYLKEGSFKLTDEDDTYLYTHTTRYSKAKSKRDD